MGKRWPVGGNWERKINKFEKGEKGRGKNGMEKLSERGKTRGLGGRKRGKSLARVREGWWGVRKGGATRNVKTAR